MAGSLTKKIFEHRSKTILLSYSLVLLILIINYYIRAQEKYIIFLVPFYMIPLFVMAQGSKTTLADSILISIFSTLACYLGFVLMHDGPMLYLPENFLRLFFVLVVFILFSYILYRLKSYRVQLLEKDKAKNRNIGIISHNIKNPLTVLKLTSELLMDEDSRKNLTREQLHMLEMIHKTTETINSFNIELLNWSKMESTKLVLKKERNDYVVFVREIVNAYNDVSEKNIHLELECTEPSLQIAFDKAHMRIVLENLIGNGIKYSHAGSSITIAIRNTSNGVLTEVIDKGVGMTAEDLEKIFQPFEKGSSLPTADEPSTGLGLAIADKIICGHDSKINVKSAVNSGSCFYFTLQKA
jgi:signal transduction histidine kinase